MTDAPKRVSQYHLEPPDDVSDDAEVLDYPHSSVPLTGTHTLPSPQPKAPPTAIDNRYPRMNVRDAVDFSPRMTPLMRACIGGHREAALALINSGANVDIKDINGRTALSYAAENCSDAAVVVALVKKGARISEKDQSNRTPLSYACSNSKTELCALALTPGKLSSVRQLEKFEFFVNAADMNGRTPLSYAAESGHARAVEALIAAGAYPSGQSIILKEKRRPKKGDEELALTPDDFYPSELPAVSPLSYAAANGHADVVAVLLDHATARDETSVALKGTPPNHVAFVDINDGPDPIRGPSKVHEETVMSICGMREVSSLVLYMVFVILFSVAVHYSRDPLYSFQLNEFMKDLILFEEFPVEDTHILKTFFDVATYEEFWQYMRGPLAGALQDSDGYLYGYNRLVGVARVRQLRVQPGSCTVHEPYDAVFDNCWASYAEKREKRDPIGINETYNWYSKKELGLSENFGVPGWLAVYLGGGYILDLQGNEADSDILRIAQENAWVNEETRAVFIDFTTYNPNVNMYFNAQLVFEFLASGGIYPSYVFRTFRITDYPWIQDVSIIMMVIVVVLATVWEARQALQEGLSYFRDGWNLMDMLNLLLFYVSFAIMIYIDYAYRKLDVDPSVQGAFYDFTVIRYYVSTNFNLRAVNSFLLWFKVFKYTEFSKQTRVLVDTVKESVRQLSIVVLCTSIMIIGFAQAGQLAFGVDVADYRDFTQSLLSSVKALLGDFNFDELYTSSRIAGPLYYALFIILFFFILLNIFIAVVSNAYDDVKARHDKDADVEVILREAAYRQLPRFIADRVEVPRNPIDDAVEALFAADVNGDKYLSRAELEELFRKEQFKEGVGSLTVEEALAVYDVDHDGRLDQLEEANMLRDLQLGKYQRAAPRTAAGSPARAPPSVPTENSWRRNVGGPSTPEPRLPRNVDDVDSARLSTIEDQVSALTRKMDQILMALNK